MDNHDFTSPKSDPSTLTDLAIGYTDRDLIALYAKYPDINFDPDDFVVIRSDKENASNTSQCQTTLDEFDFSQPSTSTAHPTPLRSPFFSTPKVHGAEVNRFMQLLRDSDLPSETTQYLKGLCSGMTVLGRHFVTNRIPSSVSDEPFVIVEEFDLLLGDLTWSVTNCEMQISNIADIEALASFNLVPPDAALWAIYRQRALLIVRNTSPPSYVERRLLKCLTRVFDTQIYHPFLQKRHAMHFGDDVGIVIDATYDAVMTLYETYLRWWKVVEGLVAKYMSPLTTRILRLPELLEEISKIRQISPRTGNQAMPKPIGARHSQSQSYAAMQSGPFRSRSKYRRTTTV